MSKEVLRVELTIELPDDREREVTMVEGHEIPPLDVALGKMAVESITKNLGKALELAGMPIESIGYSWVDPS